MKLALSVSLLMVALSCVALSLMAFLVTSHPLSLGGTSLTVDTLFIAGLSLLAISARQLRRQTINPRK